MDDDSPDIFDAALCLCAQTIWESEQVQDIVRRSAELKLSNVSVNLDSLKYFMTHITRIVCQGYQPTQQDILQARSQTITVEEEVHIKLYF